MLHFVRPVVQSVASGRAENTVVTMNIVTGASGHCFAQRLVTATQRSVTAANAWCCLALDRSVRSLIGPHPVTFVGLVSS